MPSHFTLRMQFNLKSDPNEISRQLLKLIRQAPVDEIMVFFFAEELNNGHETLDQIRQWIEHSRPYRQAVKKAGVAVSLNPWHTLLHGDLFRKLKPSQPWQTMMGPDGKTCSAVVCPLDPGWREYYEQTLHLYGPEGFRVIWIDDDIRFHNHGPLEWGGCFCPLHVAEFNRRAGVAASREEIVANCTAPGQPHPWREVWMDMWEETHLSMITRWRDILAAYGTRLGLMSSGPEAHAAEGRRWGEWWKAFGGEKPFHRPHFWSYGESLGRSITNYIAALDQNRSFQPEAVDSGPEIENGFYGPWNKPFRETGAQLALAHVLGSTHLNISLYDFMGNRPDDEPERAEFLKAWRPVCDWLADEFPMSLKSVGVGVPWSETMGRTIHTEAGGGWRALECPTRGWANWLGAAGIAFSMRPSETVNAIGGPIAWNFSAEQLETWLSRGVLLDGSAAQILVERGFGELIGVSSGRLISQADTLYSVEDRMLPEFSRHPDAYISMNTCRSSKVFQGQLLPGAREASVLLSPKLERVGHGLLVFENKRGGRVAIVPWEANAFLSMFTHRAIQLRKTIKFLAQNRSCGSVSGGAWLVPQFLTDGKRWRAAVWNGCADEVSAFTLHPPQGMPKPKAAFHINGHGKKTKAHIRGNTVTLKQPLRTWEFAVIW